MVDDELISLEDFLDRKDDFSHLLVHLTRGGKDYSAKNALFNILSEKTLKALNAWCIYYKDLSKTNHASLREHFKVVCFTETPLDQINVLLKPLEGRAKQPEPYGLVFKKSYIRANGGNPVFYITKELAKPLHELYDKQKIIIDPAICRLLSFATICEGKSDDSDKNNDWHWEREWRIVGDLKFDFNNVYCGLCLESDLAYFRNNFKRVTFINPHWSKNRILDELVNKEPPKPIPEDLTF